MTAPAPDHNYSCLLPQSFTGLTDVEDFPIQFEAVSTLSNWVALTPDPRPHFFSARLTGDALTFYRSLTTAQKATTMNSSVSSGNNINPKPTFWRPKWSPSANYPAKMCPLFIGHSVISQAKLILTMPCATSSSSPHSSKGWPILSFGGKFEKPNQQWWKMHLVWHLKCNLIWTSTANSPTLPRRLLTIWLVLPRPKLKSFPISSAPSRKKWNES